jgi:eukaryotic-like serine/threonine-protein kinase
MGLVAGLQPTDPREIGPYRLLGKLGSGGMGHVFLGMSAGGRPIAVKVIREELADDPQFRSRFRREVAAARMVSGLFTAMVVDADLDGEVPWLATAYVPGPSLTDAVRQHGPFPARTLLALAAGLAESLSAIHAAGVVHRDLKPSNVLLAEDGPRVIDFGISEAAEASALTGANVVIGSPGFMSPEQVLGQEIGPPSDIFSLGAVLTFAGTAQGPFGSGSDAALVYRLVNSPARLGLLPEEIRPLVGSCLAKHPSDRPTARQLLAEVGAIQPAPGWLSESIIYGSGEPSADLLVSATTSDALAFAGAAAGAGPKGSAGDAGRHARRRISRPLASAGITGALVAAAAATVFALTGAGPQPLANNQAQPQAGAAVIAPSSASHVSVTPTAPPSKTPAVPAPNAYLTPSLSEFLTTSPAKTVLPTEPASAAKSGAASASSSPSASSSASASASASASSSASASPTDSASASPTDTPTPTPTDTPTPTPTPTPTDTPTPTPTDTPTPTPTDSASASPSDSGTDAPPASTTPSASAS